MWITGYALPFVFSHEEETQEQGLLTWMGWDRRSRRVVGLLGLWISQYGALWILYDICHNSPWTAIPFNTSWKIQWLGLYNQSKLNVKEKPFFHSIQFSRSPLMITHALGITVVSLIENSYMNKRQPSQTRMVTLTAILYCCLLNTVAA